MVKVISQTIKHYYKYLREPIEGYKVLMSLKSTGSQYIDTGIVPNANTIVEEEEISNTGSYNNGWGSAASQEAFIWRVGSNNNSGCHVSSNWAFTTLGYAELGTTHKFYLKSGEQRYDGVLYSTNTIGSTASSGQTMYLFAEHDGWSPYITYASNIISYCKIWDGETLVRNFVPVQRISDGVLGLYDKANNSFYTNSGSGTFIAGDIAIGEGTPEDYDFYEDVEAYKLSTKTVRHYYKQGTTPNATIIGSPTISNGVVSGFSSSNYLTTPNIPNFSNSSSFEITVKFKTNSNISDYLQWIIMNSYGNGIFSGVNLRIQTNGKLELSLGNGSSNIGSSTQGSYTLLTNTDYWVKITFDNSVYNLAYSLDGESYIQDISISNSSKATTTYPFWLGNFNYTTATADQHFLGSIDLTKSYIKIDNQYWWRGTFPVECSQAEAEWYEDELKYYVINQ